VGGHGTSVVCKAPFAKVVLQKWLPTPLTPLTFGT
jgi:hypothetical protein